MTPTLVYALCDFYDWVHSTCGKAIVAGVVLKVGLFDDCVVDKIKNKIDIELPTPLGGELRCCICGVLIGPGVGYYRRKFRGRFYKYCGDSKCLEDLERQISWTKRTSEHLELDSYMF
jgi:hypothetical protein